MARSHAGAAASGFCLRAGDLRVCEKAVEDADKHGDEISDAALRDVGAEITTALVQERFTLAPGHLQVLAYCQRAARRSPLGRKRGGQWATNWLRNVGLCILIQWAVAQFGVFATRGQDSRRDQRAASGISLVVAGLALNRFHVEESTVQRKIWNGLPGALVQAMPILPEFFGRLDEHWLEYWPPPDGGPPSSAFPV